MVFHVNVLIGSLVILFIPVYIILYFFLKKPLYEKSIHYKEEQNLFFHKINDQFALLKFIKINADFTTRTVRYLIALTDSISGSIEGVILCPGGELGKNFTYVTEKSFKCQRSIPMSFFERYKGQVVYNP